MLSIVYVFVIASYLLAFFLYKNVYALLVLRFFNGLFTSGHISIRNTMLTIYPAINEV